jgi:hypothetical protein
MLGAVALAMNYDHDGALIWVGLGVAILAAFFFLASFVR